MMAQRESRSALLKNKIDLMEHRLRELETSAAAIRRAVEELKGSEKVVETSPPPPVKTLKKQIVREPLPPKIRKVKRPSKRSTKFSEQVLNQIRLWIEQGVSRQEIASKIGTTVSSLQVTCSNRGVSLWPKNRVRYQPVEVVYEEEMA